MSWPSFKSFPKNEFVTLGLLFSACVLFRYLGITCVFFTVTGIPCPTCYMGRALVALVKGNLKLYAAYNIMALPCALVLVCELFHRYWGKYRVLLRAFCGVVLSANTVYYISRILWCKCKIHPLPWSNAVPVDHIASKTVSQIFLRGFLTCFGYAVTPPFSQRRRFCLCEAKFSLIILQNHMCAAWYTNSKSVSSWPCSPSLTSSLFTFHQFPLPFPIGLCTNDRFFLFFTKPLDKYS